MSFLSVLGKIGKLALPFIAGVGPIADKVIDGIDIAGQMAGGAARNRAADRGAQGEYDLMRTQTQNRAALENAAAQMQAEGTRRGQLVGLDRTANYKSSADPRAVKFGGEQHGSAVSPETQALMRERTMKALQTGSDTPTLQTMPAKPGGGATGMDTFLRTLQGVGTGLGALQQSGILGQGDGKQAAVNAPADLEAIIFGNRDEEDPLLRRGN